MECTFAEAPPPRGKPAAAAVERRDDETLTSTTTGNRIDLATRGGSRSSPIVSSGLGSGENHSALEIHDAHGLDLPLEVSPQATMASTDTHVHQTGSNGNDQRSNLEAQTGMVLGGEDTGPVLNAALDFEDMDFASGLQYADNLLQTQMPSSLCMLPKSIIGETDARRSCNHEAIVPSADWSKWTPISFDNTNSTPTGRSISIDLGCYP